jgi:hypothetical protein
MIAKQCVLEDYFDTLAQVKRHRYDTNFLITLHPLPKKLVLFFSYLYYLLKGDQYE